MGVFHDGFRLYYVTGYLIQCGVKWREVDIE